MSEFTVTGWSSSSG